MRPRLAQRERRWQWLHLCGGKCRRGAKYRAPHLCQLTVMHCTALHCTVNYYTTLHWTVHRCITLNCTALSWTSLHFTALKRLCMGFETALHCMRHKNTLNQGNCHIISALFLQSYFSLWLWDFLTKSVFFLSGRRVGMYFPQSLYFSSFRLSTIHWWSLLKAFHKVFLFLFFLQLLVSLHMVFIFLSFQSYCSIIFKSSLYLHLKFLLFLNPWSKACQSRSSCQWYLEEGPLPQCSAMHCIALY